MFWESATLPPEITEETTLEDFLDDDYVVQRVVSQNVTDINYIINGDRISKMIELVTNQTDITFDIDRFKRPSIAAEILSSDVAALVDHVLLPKTVQLDTCNSTDKSTERNITVPHLNSLLAFLGSENPLNPLSASFFTKIMTNLLCSRATVLLPYLLKESDFLPNMLRHIETSAICDLLIDFVLQEHGQQHTVAQWFLDFKLIPQLLGIISATESSERHESSTRCLVELIAFCRTCVAANSPMDVDGDSSATSGIPLPPPSHVANHFEVESQRALLAKALSVLDVIEGEEFLTNVLEIILHPASSCSSSRLCAIDTLLACIDKAKLSNGQPPVSGDDSTEPIISSSLMMSDFLNSHILGSSVNCSGSRQNSPLLVARSKRLESLVAKMIRPQLPRLYSLLQSGNSVASQQHYPIMPTTVGVLSPPFGRIRLAIVNLVSALCQLGDVALLDAICQTRFLTLIMHFFEIYPFNTLLHKAVTCVFKQLFSSQPPASSAEVERTATATATAMAMATTLTTKEEKVEEEEEKAVEIADGRGNTGGVSLVENGDPNRPRQSANGDGVLSHLASTPAVEDKTVSAIPERNSLLRHLLEDCCVIDWILRLSCISIDRLHEKPEDPSSVCRLSTTRPKPGYSGHLWQIANIVVSFLAAHGRSSDLAPETASKWDLFVNNYLEAINEAQRITKDESSIDIAVERSPFALDNFGMGGSGFQMAELFKIIQGGANFPFMNSDFQFGARGRNPTDECGGRLRTDSNEDAFDGDDEDEDDEDVDNNKDGEDPTADVFGDAHYDIVDPSRSIDEDVGGDQDSDSSDEEEEDLRSPLTIRQERTNQAQPGHPAVLTTINGAALGKPLDTSTNQPWLAPNASASASPPVQSTDTPPTDSDVGWANFESAHLNQS